MLLSANASSQTNSFITDNSNNNLQLTLTGDTRAQSFNPYTPGYYSVLFTSANSSYFNTPSSTNNALGSGDYTIEFWAYSKSLGTSNSGCVFYLDSGNNYQQIIMAQHGNAIIKIHLLLPLLLYQQEILH